MFNLNLRIANPFRVADFDLRNHVCFSKKLSEYKAFEMQVSTMPADTTFELDVELSWSGHDHAGPLFSLTLLWFYFAINVHDTRHWDYDNRCWEVCDDNSNKTE